MVSTSVVSRIFKVANALRLVRKRKGCFSDMPDPGPGEAQVRVQAVGVCGSDLHAYAEGGIGGKLNAYPMVLGHEPAGGVA